MSGSNGSHNGMRTATQFITPETAAAWLAANNTDNRRLRPRLVDQLVDMIETGRFRTTHQGIAFYEDGRLADGQHRLSAIVRADRGVNMNVTWGVPLDALQFIDKGAGRNQVDDFHFQGNRRANNTTVAVCRCLIMQLGAEGASESRESWATAPIPGDAFAFYWGQMFPAVEFSVRTPKMNYVSTPVRAAVASAWFTQDHERLTAFMRILLTGEIDSPQDRAAVRLRDYLFTGGSSGSATVRQELFLKTCSVLRHFLEGRNVQRIYATRDSAFKMLGHVTLFDPLYPEGRPSQSA